MANEPDSAGAVVLKAALAAVPAIGGSLVVLVDAVRDRRQARLRAFADDLIEGLTNEQLDDLEVILRHDEVIQDLVVDAATAAALSKLQIKRRALAQSIARAAFTGDVDVEALFLAALADVEEPHLRVLLAFTKSWRELQLERPDHVVEHLMWSMDRQDLDQALPDLVPVMGVLLAVLVRHNLLDRSQSQTLGGGATRWTITDFGQLFLKRLGHDMRDYTVGVDPRA